MSGYVYRWRFKVEFFCGIALGISWGKEFRGIVIGPATIGWDRDFA